MPRSEPRGAVTIIVAARALSEGVAFAIVASFVHSITVGREPLSLWPAAMGLFGATLLLSAILRERGTTRQSGTLAAIVIAGAAAWGLSLEARSPDGLAVLTRIVAFAIAGEAYLWRVLSLARGLHRWREVRDGALFALVGVVLASLVPGQLDRAALPTLGLAVVVSAAVALSLARSTEELALAAAPVRGRPARSAATGSAFVLGILAVAVALLMPTAQELLGSLAASIGPVLGDLLFLLLLPLGYLAASLVYLFQWLGGLIAPGGLNIRFPALPRSPADELERLREIEELRPLVFGAVEVLIGLVALGFAVALIARLVQERRALLPEGAILERERVEGIGLGATLRALFPRRRGRSGPPADDGSPAAALRRIYWRLLALGERRGAGWREPAETPAEHEARLARGAASWREAAPIVRAFEDLRYGEREPERATVDAARDALRRLEESA